MILAHMDDYLAFSEEYDEERKLMKKFAVLHEGEDCWTELHPDNTQTPLRFESREQAEDELTEYLAEQHAAVDEGDMIEKYPREAFEIVEVNE